MSGYKSGTWFHETASEKLMWCSRLFYCWWCFSWRDLKKTNHMGTIINTIAVMPWAIITKVMFSQASLSLSAIMHTCFFRWPLTVFGSQLRWVFSVLVMTAFGNSSLPAFVVICLCYHKWMPPLCHRCLHCVTDASIVSQMPPLCHRCLHCVTDPSIVSHMPPLCHRCLHCVTV